MDFEEKTRKIKEAYPEQVIDVYYLSSFCMKVIIQDDVDSFTKLDIIGMAYPFLVEFGRKKVDIGIKV